MRVRGMNANFPRSWISPIITLKQPASARGLEKGEQSFSRPLLGAAAYLFILREIHERSVLLPPPPLSSVRLLPLFFRAKSTVGGVFSFAPRNLASGVLVLHLLEGGTGASRTVCGLGARPICGWGGGFRPGWY